jgi:hypothetical protein
MLICLAREGKYNAQYALRMLLEIFFDIVNIQRSSKGKTV